MKIQYCLLVIYFLPFVSQSQDSALIKKIDSISQYDYDHIDTTLYYLTTTDFFNQGSATMVHVGKYRDNIHRIVCISRHSLGEYAIEFYFFNGSPVFVFETTSYAREEAPSWTEKNFQYISVSEHRYYYWENKMVYSYGTGTDPNRSIPQHSKRLLDACNKIVNWCKKQAL